MPQQSIVATIPVEVSRHERFRRDVLDRDRRRCVLCGSPDGDAHHVFASALWDDGANIAGNGVTLCAKHRTQALETLLSVETLLEAAGLVDRPLPPQLHAVERYDRWGNPILANGRRARGELFLTPDAQHWLARGGALDRFVPWVKYPRTYVLPWSETVGEGDRMLASLAPLACAPVIATEKMDGENVSLYRDFLHTRSVARIAHPSRAWLDAFWERIRGDIPDGWRICGEYLRVGHTVRYDRLPSYFMAFAVWDDRNICLSWADTILFLARLGIEPVPVLYEGLLDPVAIDRAWRGLGTPSEGYVVRTIGEIAYRDFRRLAGKFIRADYVQSEPVRNNIRSGSSLSTNNLTEETESTQIP